MFTVKEAAELMEISPHSLRFYDNEGLLPSLSKRNGRRMFTYEDLEWVYNIMCWRKTGMSLADIRRYIELAREGDDTVDERYEIILRQRERAMEEVKEAKQRLKMLHRKVMWYQALKAGDNPNRWRPDIEGMIRKAQAKKKKSKTSRIPKAV